MASHFTTLRDDNVRSGSLSSCTGVLNLTHDVHTVDDVTEDDMFVVEEGRGDSGNEKL